MTRIFAQSLSGQGSPKNWQKHSRKAEGVVHIFQKGFSRRMNEQRKAIKKNKLGVRRKEKFLKEDVIPTIKSHIL